MQIQPFNFNELPAEFINLPIENLLYQLTEEGKNTLNIDNLLPRLNQDASYYQDHKILLTKALRWEQYNRLPSLLLRSKNLEHALAWLKIARRRSQHQPTPLQEEFILASSQQPRSHFQDVFISYSPIDADFARRVNEALQLQGKTTWFDPEILLDKVERKSFQAEIERGIDSSDTLVFIISPALSGFRGKM